MKVYPLADRKYDYDHMVRAISTGERRPPRKGEWYLSGAIVEAYQAPNDLTTAYHIAKLVRIETHTVTKITEVLP